MFKVLVLGGYGNFGARICRALATDEGIAVVAAGRHCDDALHAKTFAASLAPRIARLQIDITAGGLAANLSAAQGHLVIHCVGPYQGQSYHVARACAAARIHYLDLADGREFVANFSNEMAEEARQAGIFMACGASTLPALSSAVVDESAKSLPQIDSIQSVIAPGQHAPRGRATLEAVFSYAGKPVPVWREGAWVNDTGWLSLRRAHVQGLQPRIAAVCEVPDQALFPQRYAGVRTVEFHAALEIAVQHRAIAALAWLIKQGMPLNLKPLAGLMETVAHWLDPWGSGTGGMLMRIAGRDAQGEPRVREFHLLAPNNHGPEIPVMPAILLARKLARAAATGKAIGPLGAAACMGFLTLEDFSGEFVKWGITTQWIESESP